MTTAIRRRFVVLVAVAAVLVTAVAAPGVAEAHAELERSSPAPDAVIPRAPDTVEIWFTQELFKREGANTIVVEGPDGRVDDGNVVIDDADREHLTVGLEADLAPGEYRVSWTSLSAIDGDQADGEFVFTIDPDAPEPTATPDEPDVTATPDATATADATIVPTETPEAGGSDGASFPTWVLIAATAIIGSAGLGGWALLRDSGEGASKDSGP